MNIEGILRQTNRANFDALYLFSKTNDLCKLCN